MATGNLRPDNWDEYVGQERLKSVLKVTAHDVVSRVNENVSQVEPLRPKFLMSKSAKEQMAAERTKGLTEAIGKYSAPPILICGPAGYGKTSLALLYATDLMNAASDNNWPIFQSPNGDKDVWDEGGVPTCFYRFAEVQGRDLTYDILDEYVTHLQTQGVLFVDEVQDIPRSLQTSFYQLLHEGVWESKKVGGRFRPAGFTIIAATTDEYMLKPAMRSRFRMLKMDPYTESEFGKVVDITASKLGLKLSRTAKTLVVERGRRNPRQIAQNLVYIQQHHRFSGNGDKPVNETALAAACEMLGFYDHGLTREDIAVLKLISARKRVGVAEIVDAIGFGSEENYRLNESYLVASGWVSRSPSGRVLTPEGDALLQSLPAI